MPNPLCEPAPSGPGDPPACLLRVKAVPGARRDAIVGPLGDDLKIRVSAPPEAGRANDAIAALLARALALPARAVTLESGPAAPRKRFRIEGLDAEECARRLRLSGP